MSRYKYHRDRTLPKGEEIFVFGSNEAGRHGAGAARIAMRNFGARYGIGIGLVGQSYAVPTKDVNLQTLSKKSIRRYVREFREHTKRNKHETYFITRLGCGLAGYDDVDIAPLFRGATRRCNFPKEWKEYLE
jgi:hypothetical protein